MLVDVMWPVCFCCERRI